MDSQTGQVLIAEHYQHATQINDAVKGGSLWHCIAQVPYFAGSVIVKRGPNFVHFTAVEWRRTLLEGSELIGQLSAAPCSCRSKTTLLVNTSQTNKEINQLDQDGIGSQCIEASTVNLGLPLRTGYTIHPDGACY